MKLRLVLCFALALFAVALRAESRASLWEKVEQARSAKLPKSALAALEPIIASARADGAYAEALKAIGTKIALERQIDGNKPEEQITRLLAELEQAPPPMQPAIQALIAQWYWQYFEAHRWKHMQRTRTSTPPGPDFQTWDLAHLLAEIDRRFTAALADEKTLQATPISAYAPLLVSGSMSDAYRPTLFDFLANEALRFYQAGEHDLIRAEDAFEVDDQSPIFADVDEFIRWQPATTDSDSPQLKAIRLYQKLLAFHRHDRDRSAFYDADLARLVYGHNIARGPERDSRYRAALERFIAATARHEISARALAELARQWHESDDPTKAHELAQRGLKAFPKTPGGAACYNLIQQIEAKSAEIDTEFVWNAPWPTIEVTYRNVTRVHFRAVAVDFEQHLAQQNYGGSVRLNRDATAALLRKKPAAEWSSDLPPTRDFRPRTESIPVPKNLKPGFYYLISSHHAGFTEDENQISVATVWVSDLALITKTRGSDEGLDGFVLHANSGEPVSGATVRGWRQENGNRFAPLKPVTTDADGRFQFKGTKTQLIILAEHNGHTVSTHTPIYIPHIASNTSEEQTVFFTDRSIYRPGQTISYKGIRFRHDASDATYETLANTRVTVLLHDPNGKEVARATHTTNDYGSFSGTFTAPRNGLLGDMHLSVEGDQRSQTYFSVEEYKRPKFQVEIPSPTEAPKLGQPARVTVKATAYTGAAIGGAKVKWHVTRSAQLPRWCWWSRPTAPAAIAHGTAQTAADGTFTIEFPATPDRAVAEKDAPVFTFAVHADVTDTTGETRSADRSLRVGYTALEASLTADTWQTPDRPVVFHLAAATLDGTPQRAEGELTIHALKQPASVGRADLSRDGSPRYWIAENDSSAKPTSDPTNPETWEIGAVVSRHAFQVGSDGRGEISASLPAGLYRAELSTQDRFGRAVTARHTVQVLDPTAARFSAKLPDHLAAPTWSVEPGSEFTALWGTGYDTGRAYVELECNGRTLKRYWTAANRTQELISLPITEDMRGGVTLRVTFVRENRAYLNSRIIDVPWTNQQLAIKWESFRSKLLPGQPETWSAVITGADAQRAAAEMVATLYDASLDQFTPHHWPEDFGVLRREASWPGAAFQNVATYFRHVAGHWETKARNVNQSYRAFTEYLGGWRYGSDEEAIALSAFEVRSSAGRGYAAETALEPREAPGAVASKAALALPLADGFAADIAPNSVAAPPPLVANLDHIAARKNLQETAFFFPHLQTDASGVVRLQFTMPEALTEWKFLGFAHDTKLRAGSLTAKVVTAKDLMVEPNPPRFVREGDVIEFTVKVSNQTDQPQTGQVRLTFADAATLASADAALGNGAPAQSFDVPAKQSRSFSWRIAVPDGQGFLTYKAVGATATASDGEEGFLPVLSRRVLVTESLPLPVRGPATKDFTFTKLLDSAQSDTLRHQSLTVQMVSQPAWYAVMALPYLMEFPHECSEQLFNRLYANVLARHIANSDPNIARIFEQWRNTPALDSPLLKNEDLKSVLIEETPWLRQATRESESRRNLGLLFDSNRLDAEMSAALAKLAERQRPDGLWSWFPGGEPSDYISLYVVAGFGRLRHLGINTNDEPALRALGGLDAGLAARHREILRRPDSDKPHLTALDALYLYGRSFYFAEHLIAAEHRAAVDYFLDQARRYWTTLGNRQSEAQLALALQRFGDRDTAQAIMKSLRERSVRSDELGMFWRDSETSWWWYHAPIETQALMIEAFDEIAHDAQAVEDCKVWLLKQKQTQNWPTTKATADAIYALLLRGNKLLASDALVEVALAGEPIRPEKTEAGTGFYEQKFVRDEIKPAMGHITVKKTDAGVSWGSVHWQYLEDMRKITPHTGTPLTLKKTLFLKENTARGAVLKPVTGPVAVGDELVVRIELRTDRDMEYVHLKDQRGSGTEPVNVLSGYRYQDGLGYYESMRDTASHFFIERLPKGTYVFEYSTRVQLRGTYQTGIAEIQCMYAPEFNSHSESLNLEVK